jgi:energy-coupling factor transport system substrate-specific component
MTEASSTPSRPAIVWRWRVVDIVVAAVIGVAGGVVYWAWGFVYDAPSTALGLLLPGTQPLPSGIWLIAGVLAALIIRKPGAAVFAELVAASVETLVGGKWGPIDLVYGLVQGLGAELVFAVFLYASWRVGVAILAGAFAGVGGAILDLIVYYPGYPLAFDGIYLASFAVSGALLGGLISWLLTRALAATGALNRFASGRQGAARV